jgi:hypothetical protein
MCSRSGYATRQKSRASFTKESGGEPVFVQDLGRQRGGRPFTVRWDLTVAPAPAGAYKLVLNGYVLSTNDPVSQVVRFYHQPVIK